MSVNDWKEIYKHKIVSASEALKCVKSGDAVVFHSSASEPTTLVNALVDRASELRDVQIIHMTSLGEAAYTKPELAKSFRHNGLFISGSTRKAVNEGRADFTPCLYSAIPRMFENKIIPADVFLMQITPPNEEGYCSYGLSVDYAKAAAGAAGTVIAQVNKLLPRTGGEKIHLDQITYIVEKDEPVL